MFPRTKAQRRISERLTEEQRLAAYYEGTSAIWHLLTEEERQGLQDEWEAERQSWEERRRQERRAYFSGN